MFKKYLITSNLTKDCMIEILIEGNHSISDFYGVLFPKKNDRGLLDLYYLSYEAPPDIKMVKNMVEELIDWCG